MPSVPLYLPATDRKNALCGGRNPLPELLQTPTGLAILEVQGTINIPAVDEEAADGADPSSAMAVGRVVFPDYRADDPTGDTFWMKRVHLYVGRHQRLTGEVKQLSSPFAVIRRKSSGPSIERTEELEVAEIIYYKVLFSSRPEPVSE
ncbi:MAG: hypothetical protein L6R39_006795 [Caloplaca ligustica]|nr:MAG: hypothetical protein L6R39_006795 [Caloplaca ligustica]